MHRQNEHREVFGEAARQAAAEAANRLRLALILSCGVALPPLAETITYISEGGWTDRRIGRMERRALLRQPALRLAESDSEGLFAILQLIDDARPATCLGEVQQAVDTLGAASLPDFEAIDGLMHRTIAFESLLLADVTIGVTNAFTERGAALLADTADEIPLLRSRLASLYALRSDALHGRDFTQSLALNGLSVDELNAWVRRALGCALLRVFYVCRDLPNPSQRLITLRFELEAARGSSIVPASLSDAPEVQLL